MDRFVALLGVAKHSHQRPHTAEIEVFGSQILLVSETEVNEAVEIVEGGLIVGVNAHGWDCNRWQDTVQGANKITPRQGE